MKNPKNEDFKMYCKQVIHHIVMSLFIDDIISVKEEIEIEIYLCISVNKIFNNISNNWPEIDIKDSTLNIEFLNKYKQLQNGKNFI